MPAEHGFRFDGLHRVENVGSQRVHAGKSQPVDAGEGQTVRGLGRSTFSWWRSTRSSASSAACDRKQPSESAPRLLAKVDHRPQARPIRAGFLARLGFRQGQLVRADSRFGANRRGASAYHPGLRVCYRQHSLNHQQTSQIPCLPSSHSFQAYGSKPTRGRAKGKPKMARRQTEKKVPNVALTLCSR
jgi:hypothetical protein